MMHIPSWVGALAWVGDKGAVIIILGGLAALAVAFVRTQVEWGETRS